MPTLPSRTAFFCAVLPAFVALLLTPTDAAGQTEDVPQVTRTFALENARVVQAPGRVLERATVIIRDGLILAVGENATVPFDAQRIAADSLDVYAGFIDGLSHAGIPKPKRDESDREQVERPGEPPPDRAGIQPQRDARAMLEASESSIEKLRKAGFTVAHTVPYGQMLPGSGAVILLAGDAPNEMVLRGDASLFAQLEGARRVYPSTTMAVLSQMRQLYRDAERLRSIEAMYASNPSGLERPVYNPVLSSFFPVLDGEKRVFYLTNSALDVHRVLSLQRELGFPLVLAGLEQSFDALDALKSANVPLLLTLDLPEEPKAKQNTADSTDADPLVADADSAKAMTPEPPGSFFVSDFRTRSYEDIESEKENLEARQKVVREQYYATAGMLHEAGLRFGFSTMDVKPNDIMKNLRLMIENGLPEETALAALTTHAAQVLNLSSTMGTVEAGKIANLVVTSGPLFDEDMQMRYVFVDGQMFEIEGKNKAGTVDASFSPVGEWSYTAESPQGTISGVITLSGSAGDFSGTISSDTRPGAATLDNVEYEDGTLSFSFDSGDFGILKATINFDGEDIDGSFEVPGFGNIPVSGSRTSGPQL